MDYEKNYGKVALYIKNRPLAYRILMLLYKGIPPLTAGIYCLMIIYHMLSVKDVMMLCRIILVPLTGFVAVSLIRKLFNTKRPYVRYNIEPLINKEKRGESFPSRHTFSIGIIAMVCMYTNVWLGITMLLLSVILALSRVLAGVHYIKDVVAALVLAVIWGVAGMVLI